MIIHFNVDELRVINFISLSDLIAFETEITSNYLNKITRKKKITESNLMEFYFCNDFIKFKYCSDWFERFITQLKWDIKVCLTLFR